MNGIESAIGWALLHLIWQGTIIAALLATTLLLLGRRNAAARYHAACFALLLLVILPTATAIRSYGAEPFRGIQTTSAWIAAADAHLPQLVIAWLIGVALLSFRLFGGWMRARRLATRGTKPSPAWQRTVDRIAASIDLRRTVRLLESAAVEVPTVVGWLKPVILLPVAALSGLAPQQVEMVLAHELAHIRRNDYLVNLLQTVVETLLFYHPAVWWISRQVRIERENCCDDLAVSVCGSRLQYARALTRLEELRVDVVPPLLAANGASLIDRVRRLTTGRNEAPVRISAYAGGVVLAILVVCLITTPAMPLFAPPPVMKSFTAAHPIFAVIAPTPVVSASTPVPKPVKVAHHARVRRHVQVAQQTNVMPPRDVDTDAANLRMPHILVIADQQVVLVALRNDGTFIIETVQPIRVTAPKVDHF